MAETFHSKAALVTNSADTNLLTAGSGETFVIIHCQVAMLMVQMQQICIWTW